MCWHDQILILFIQNGASLFIWRRGRDSNPRNAWAFTWFRVKPIRPALAPLLNFFKTHIYPHNQVNSLDVTRHIHVPRPSGGFAVSINYPVDRSSQAVGHHFDWIKMGQPLGCPEGERHGWRESTLAPLLKSFTFLFPDWRRFQSQINIICIHSVSTSRRHIFILWPVHCIISLVKWEHIFYRFRQIIV